MGNCHSVGEQRSIRTQTLGAIPVFKPLTGQCTGMAPICIKRGLSHDGVWCGRGEWGLGDHKEKNPKSFTEKKKFKINWHPVLKKNSPKIHTPF